MENDINIVAKEIYKTGCLAFGDYTLKSGVKSPVYVDLRKIMFTPELLDSVVTVILKEINRKSIQYDILCGVPYACIPVATIMSFRTLKPLSLRRKETKTYGTKQLIEGTFKSGDKCLIIEDVMTTGSSILETISDLEEAGLIVKDIFVILIRQPSSVEVLSKKGYHIHYLFTINEFADILETEGLITKEQNALAKSIAELQVISSSVVTARHCLPYRERAAFASNKMASKLFSLMDVKQTNLCVAADLPDMESILKLARSVGPYICVLKLHLSCITDKNRASAMELKQVADEFNFIILEDRKLADIGYVVSLQYSVISEYTGLVTAHSITGSSILDAIQASDGYDVESTGVFLVAQLSSAGCYITTSYTQKTVALAEAFPELVTGIVCQEGTVFSSPGFIQLTPGVSLADLSDDLGQQYRTPEIVVKDKFADIAVVGRGIVSASNPAEVAKQYQSRLWDAYLSRISS